MDIKRQQQGPLDKVRRVEQPHGLAFAPDLVEQRGSLARESDRVIRN